MPHLPQVPNITRSNQRRPEAARGSQRQREAAHESPKGVRGRPRPSPGRPTLSAETTAIPEQPKRRPLGAQNRPGGRPLRSLSRQREGHWERKSVQEGAHRGPRGGHGSPNESKKTTTGTQEAGENPPLGHFRPNPEKQKSRAATDRKPQVFLGFLGAKWPATRTSHFICIYRRCVGSPSPRAGETPSLEDVIFRRRARRIEQWTFGPTAYTHSSGGRQNWWFRRDETSVFENERFA